LDALGVSFSDNWDACLEGLEAWMKELIIAMKNNIKARKNKT
jgi:hypothetical protein